MEEEASQWEFEEEWEEEEEDTVELILATTREESLGWLKTYGRGFIREWMADNAKTLLAADGVISRKKMDAVTDKSSARKKKAIPLNVTQEIIKID